MKPPGTHYFEYDDYIFRFNLNNSGVYIIDAKNSKKKLINTWQLCNWSRNMVLTNAIEISEEEVFTRLL